jgi:hypothetical protein
MRKNYALLKQYGLALALLFTTTIIIYSCKKDSNIENTIESAKAWYNVKSRGKQIELKSTENITLKAGMFKFNDDRDMIHVPIIIKNNEGLKLEGSFMLLIIKENETYSSRVIFNEQSDYFNALISDEGIKQAYLNILNISEDKMLIQDKSVVVPNINRGKLMTVREEPVMCTDWYWTTYDSWTGTVYDEIYLYTSCTGGGGGTAPGTGASNVFTKKVDVDPNARQCLKDIKAALEALGMKNTSTESSLIAGVLNKLNLSNGEGFNGILTEGSTSKINYIAETTPPDYNNIAQNVVTEIKFNSTYLNKMTDLAVAGVMMHEYVHAYFSWNLYLMERNKNVDPKFKETYDLLFTENGQINYSPEKDSQHEQIAKSFVGEISAMLKQYAISNQIALPTDSEYFNKMAWAGLEKTSLYKFAPAGTNTTLSAEQGLLGNKITQVIKCKQ